MVMSFRDDFNTLNTDIWEVFNTLPSGNTVDVADGYLRFNLSLTEEEKGIIGLRYKSLLNLVDKRITFTPKFVNPSSRVFTWIGIAVTNAPFTWYNTNPPALRGFTYWLAGDGYDDKICAAWQLLGGNVFRPAEFECIRYPPTLNCYIATNGIYLYVGDVPMDCKIIPFDLSNSYLQLCVPAFGEHLGGSTTVLVDYIEVAPVEFPETQPNLKQGSTLEMPLFPPGTVPSIFSVLMTPLIGNVFLGLAEKTVKPKVVKPR
jgi:hypothetical protein